MPIQLRVIGALLLGELLLGTRAALPVHASVVQAESPIQSEACSVTIPSGDEEGWQPLRYRNIPANSVDFSALGLRIQVDHSAAPLVYPLSVPIAVARLGVRGRVEGDLRVAPARQGDEGFDDYVLRAGLVLTGSRRLGFFRRMFSPEWVKRLHALAPPNQGISKVRFFNIGTDPDQIGQRRVHPLSELLEEEVVAVPRTDGTFELDIALNPTAEAVAVWLSSDGDDTGSVFTVLIERIVLSTAAAHCQATDRHIETALTPLVRSAADRF